MQLNYFAILLSLGILILKRFSFKICQYIQNCFNKTETAEIKTLYEELAKLKRERDSYNIVDQFAQHMRCDRKVNKLVDAIQSLKSSSRTENLSKSM
jgi:hypothetical protein